MATTRLNRSQLPAWYQKSWNRTTGFLGGIPAGIRSYGMLWDDWMETVLQRVSLRDEVARVRAERERTQEKLRRLGKAFVDSLIDEPDYERQKAQYQFELASLVVPEADAIAEAGRLVRQLPELWAAANLTERRKLLLTVLDAVYVETTGGKVAVSMRPKAAFAPLLSGTFTSPLATFAATAR